MSTENQTETTNPAAPVYGAAPAPTIHGGAPAREPDDIGPSASDHQIYAKAMLDTKMWTQEQYDQYLAQNGSPAGEAPTEIDAAFVPVTDIAKIDFGPAFEAKMLDRAGAQELGAAAIAGRFTAADASELVRVSTDVERRFNAMSETQQEIWAREQWTLTVKHLGHGDEAVAKSKIEEIGAFLNELDGKAPGIRERILNSPVAGDHRFLVRAAQHIERLAMRKAERDSRRK